MTTPSAHCHVLVERVTNGHQAARPREIRAFAKCRNERLRLPAFLEHYRRLGVDSFFIVDNDSSDGTAEYLAGQPDVHLFRTASRFREARGGTDWLNALLAEYGVGTWCVTADIDELLVYPGSEHASLHTLTGYLDRHGYQAVSCMLLDLYPAGPLKECSYKAGDDLLAAAPYFDAGPYKASPYDLCPGVVMTGGMRERIFYSERKPTGLGAKIRETAFNMTHRVPLLRNTPRVRAQRQRSPCLTKVPLIRWDRHSQYIYSTHFVSHRIVAPDTGVLLHFKFLHDFHGRSTLEAARGEYHEGASEYLRYAERLRKNPDMSLSCEASARFEGTPQLVRLGLMRETEAWAAAKTNSSE